MPSERPSSRGWNGHPTVGEPLRREETCGPLFLLSPSQPSQRAPSLPRRSLGGRVQTLVLPDTHFSRTTASQGGPRIPAKGMWALRRTVLTRARVRAACPEGRFFGSRNKQLSLLGRSSSYLYNPPKPPWRVGIRGVTARDLGSLWARPTLKPVLIPQAEEAGNRPASSSSLGDVCPVRGEAAKERSGRRDRQGGGSPEW